ncbi:hypothetical protein ACSBL2_02220 [Pedobacter sp. AW31-3R]|uniref:hypothetical protein n=1 Tax=Pedobacter sp. AW31-3R TaxID=3445781 RepID=UPI003FA14C3E
MIEVTAVTLLLLSINRKKMFKTITYYLISLSFITLFISACKKQEPYLPNSGNYATVQFINNSNISTLDFGIKYNGEPMGRLVLAGPGTFTFYNKTTGEILLEKKLDIKANETEPWYFFQPDPTIEPQLIKNTQANEPAPEAGYFKIKFANLSKNALPYTALDVVLNYYDENGMIAPYDTLKSVGSQLDTAGYYLVKESADGFFPLSFLDHETQQPVLDKAGNTYIAQLGIYIDPSKDVFTFYFTEPEYDEYDGYIFRNNKYYDIYPVELFTTN